MNSNNDNELQQLTKVNFDILWKLKKSENENIIKTQQLEQLKKNYEMINNQFIEFTKNNYNTNSNEFSDFNNNYENVSMNANNKDKNIGIDENNNILQDNHLKIDNKNYIKLINSQNTEENSFRYSNDNYLGKLEDKKKCINYINNLNKNDNINIETKK